jgi:hypothetical protein
LVEEWLATFLVSILDGSSAASIQRDVERRPLVLLLDGLDEAIGRLPWLLTSILEFHGRRPDVQIVTTSRMRTGTLDALPFLPVTLIAFDRPKPENFLRGWFGASDTQQVARLLAQIETNPGMAQVVSNPLLATV